MNHADTSAINPLYLKIAEAIKERMISDLHVKAGDTFWSRTPGAVVPEEHVITAEQLLAFVREHLRERNVTSLKDYLRDRGNSDDIGMDFVYQEIHGTESQDYKCRLRINLAMSMDRVKASIRIIPDKPIPFDKLGIPHSILTTARAAHNGLIIVTGATGSGKTTTLAALIDDFNQKRGGHIVTLEDPVEFVYENNKALLTQRSVGEGGDTPSFEAGFKDAMRQDLDVLLIGELRDGATVEAAVAAAGTGHLVLATMHTSSAADTLQRINDYIDPARRDAVMSALSGNLRLICSQYRLAGLDARSVVATEILLPTKSIRTNIAKYGTDAMSAEKVRTAIKGSMSEGCLPMVSCLKKLVADKRISQEQAINLVGQEAYANG